MSEEKKCRIVDTETGECLDEKLKTLEKTSVEVEEPEICYIRDPKTKECLDEEWDMNIESMTEYFPELQGLPKEGAEHILKQASESILGYMKEENEHKKWVMKFLSPAWIKEEKERIKYFDKFAGRLKDIPQTLQCKSYETTYYGGSEPTKTVEKCPPQTDISSLQASVLKMASNYKTDLNEYLEEAIKNWQELKMYKKNVKSASKILEGNEFWRYWEYLDRFRTFYINLAKTFDKYRGYDPQIDDFVNNAIREGQIISGEIYMSKTPERIKEVEKLGWY